MMADVSSYLHVLVMYHCVRNSVDMKTLCVATVINFIQLIMDKISQDNQLNATTVKLTCMALHQEKMNLMKKLKHS